MQRNFEAANKTIDRALKLSPKALGLWSIKAQSEIAGKGTFEIAERGIKMVSTSAMPESEKAHMMAAIVQTRLSQRKYAEALQDAESIKDELLGKRPEAVHKIRSDRYREEDAERRGRRARSISNRQRATRRRISSDAPNEAKRHAKAGARFSPGWARRTRPSRKRNGPPNCSRKVSMLSRARS